MNNLKLNIILLELIRETINTPALEFDSQKMVNTTSKKIMKLIKESQK